APSGFSVVFDDADGVITSAEAAAVSFTIFNGEAGAAVDYTISAEDALGSVTGSDTSGGATHQVTGIDISSLPNGRLTLSVILTDAALNASAPQTAEARLGQSGAAWSSGWGGNVRLGDGL